MADNALVVLTVGMLGALERKGGPIKGLGTYNPLQIVVATTVSDRAARSRNGGI